jgi:hypothetical protein
LHPDARPRKKSGRLVVWAALACVCCSSAIARAGNANPNLYPLGENEPFMGNTGVGRANDTGAVYYNPSGLAELDADRISVSGSAYLAFSTHSDGFLNVDNTNVPFDASGFVTVPSLYAATRRLGDWIGALSVLVPDSVSLDNSLSFETPSTRSKIVYSLNQSELWIGLSLARKLGEHWSVGLSLYGIQHHEAQTLGVDIQNKTDANAFASSISQLSIDTFGLSAILGVTYLPTSWLRFGLRAQTPLWQLYGWGSSYETNHVVVDGTTTTSGENVTGQANSPMPFDFSLGTAVTLWKALTLLADVSLQIAESYSTFPGSLLDEMVVLNTTPRVNVGLELRLTSEFTLRLGGFYNPSTNAGTPGDANYAKDDYFGLSGGIGFSEAHVRTGLGGYFTQSSGSMTPTGTTGTTSSVTNRSIAVLLTTAYVF